MYSAVVLMDRAEIECLLCFVGMTMALLEVYDNYNCECLLSWFYNVIHHHQSGILKG